MAKQKRNGFTAFLISIVIAVLVVGGVGLFLFLEDSLKANITVDYLLDSMTFNENISGYEGIFGYKLEEGEAFTTIYNQVMKTTEVLKLSIYNLIPLGMAIIGILLVVLGGRSKFLNLLAAVLFIATGVFFIFSGNFVALADELQSIADKVNSVVSVSFEATTGAYIGCGLCSVGGVLTLIKMFL